MTFHHLVRLRRGSPVLLKQFRNAVASFISSFERRECGECQTRAGKQMRSRSDRNAIQAKATDLHDDPQALLHPVVVVRQLVARDEDALDTLLRDDRHPDRSS